MNENEKNTPQDQELDEQALEQVSGGAEAYPILPKTQQRYMNVYTCPECGYVWERPGGGMIVKAHTYCPECRAKYDKIVYCDVTRRPY